ncbi:MAG TPA: hypothetical protein VIY28_06880 [Pseudonocardiaceae bacterium]
MANGSPTLGFSHLQLEVLLTTARDSQNRFDFSLVAMLGPLGFRIYEERAHADGFASVTVACEPTGHRSRVLDQLAAERELPVVCVQPLLV